MTQTRREFMAAAGGAAILPAAASAATGETLTPEMFGAKGDGATNDTRAFQALSDHVNARGGGTIMLRARTYVVGSHGRAPNPRDGRKGEFSFAPSPILQFVGCRSPVIVRGNGATLRAAAGLRFGAFDPATGRPFERELPFADNRFRASPYFAMIEALRCSSLVEISDIELDGNVGALQIGGKWGDAGRQIPGSGILLTDNSGPERLTRIHSHHHPLDGLKITGPNERLESSLISDLLCEDNVRQGCSVTGGRNYSFTRCRFRRTGMGPVRSLPKAGVDIEPSKGRQVRNLGFMSCEFSDNGGPGLAANKGDSADARFENCTFIGTANWSAWPNKPGMRFDQCTFVGAIAHAFGGPDPARAVQFHDCRFRDDPALSLTRQVYSDERWNRSIALLRRSQNVLFNRCDFALTHQCTLPLSQSEVIFSDCRMSQRSPVQSRPRGIYRGRTIISGNADLTGSVIAGEVVLNGRRLPRTG